MAHSPRLICSTAFALLTLSIDTTIGAAGSIWLSTDEIRSLPMTGAAWTNLLSEADSDWQTPDMKAQNSDWASQAYAGALVAVRRNNDALPLPMATRRKVANAIMAGKRTMDDATDYAGAGYLDQYLMHTISRQLMGMVFAADIIDLDTFDPTLGAEFRSWLSAIRTQYVPSGPAIHNLQNWAECPTDNGSSRAMGSILAAELYLGTPGAAERYAQFFYAFGDRSFYPADAHHSPAFHENTGYYSRTSWQEIFCCGDATDWTTINSQYPTCEKIISGAVRNLDGAVVPDVSRSSAVWPPNSTGMTYSWVSLGGIVAVAEMLARQGYPTWQYTGTSNRPMLLRSLEFMTRAGYSLNSAFRWIPELVNAHYGAVFETASPQGREFSVSWTDWTHAGPRPGDKIRPAAISDLGP